MKIKSIKLITKVKEGCFESMIIHEDPLCKFLSFLSIGMVFLTSVLVDNYNIGVFAILLHFIYNIWYFFGNVKERVLFFIINFSIFLFLISRPLISMFRGNEWWYFKETSIWKALFCILLVLFLLNISFCYAEAMVTWGRGYINSRRNRRIEKEATKKKRFSFDKKIMGRICFVLFLIGMLAFLYQELPKSLYVLSHNYVDLYSEYTDATPVYIRIFATIMPYFLFGYLACFPEKRKALLPLVLYVISGLPGLFAGVRNDIMVKLVFVFMYYCLRDMVKVGADIWLGKIERILIIVSIPVIIVGLSVLNFAREGTTIKKNDGSVMTNFFYLQGTSFDTVCQGFEFEDELISSEYVVSYTFGNFIDYVKHGTASQILFGAEDLGSGNSYKMATESNNLAHHLSYAVLERSYLHGHGRGSSFIIETYLDFGYVGLIIYTVLLGAGLRLAPRLLRRGWLVKVITLITLSGVFMITRGEALGMLNYIITLQFWISVVMMMGLYFVIYKLQQVRG